MKDSSKKYLFFGLSSSSDKVSNIPYQIKDIYPDLNHIQQEDKDEVSISMKRKLEIWKTLKYKDGVLYYRNTGKVYDGSEIKKIVCREQNLRYHGHIINGKVNGKGMYYHKFTQNIKYMGDLVDGIPEGKGKKYNQEGYMEYQGDFKNGVPEGNGTYYKIGFLRYEGGFDAGLFEGDGKLYYPNGQIAYEGTFVNGKCNGHGKYFNRDGQLRYDGNFVDNKIHGEGVFYGEKGKQYNGLFENDKQNGKTFLSKKWDFYQLF